MAESPGTALAPAGFFVTAPSQLGPPSPLLADNIDPKTKDFRDLFVGSDPIDDQVQVVATTRRGSGGSVLDIGLRLSRNKLVSDIQDQVEGDMRQAFAMLIRNRDINFKRVSFGGPGPNGEPTGETDESEQELQVNIEYRNLRALDPKVRRLQLSSTPQVP